MSNFVKVPKIVEGEVAEVTEVKNLNFPAKNGHNCTVRFYYWFLARKFKYLTFVASEVTRGQK